MKKYLVVFLILFSCLKHTAQDFHLSMYDAGPLFLNPAMTGLIDSKVRVHAQYRNQWSAVAFKPFTTALLSADMAKGKWGYGVQLINMRAGIGNYNAFQGLLSTGYTVPLDKQKYHGLSFGLQAGITQKSVNSDKYYFDSQFTSRDGGSFDQGLTSNENFNQVSQILPQLNAGVMYYYSRQQSLLNPFVGFSGFNLTRPKETFFDQANHLPVRFNLHTGVRINITEMVYILPKVLIMKQGKAFEQTYALDAGYYVFQGKLFLIGGFVYRAKDASIVSLGVKKDDYTLRFGYDFNISTLKTATKTRGAYEIAFTYLMGKDKMKKIKHCPRI